MNLGGKRRVTQNGGFDTDYRPTHSPAGVAA